MNIALRKSWTQDEFFAWEGHGLARYEFDGVQPVAMTGGSLNHSRIIRNLNNCLATRLKGSSCESLGPDAGIETVGSAIRYPDALVTCSQFKGTAYTVPGVVVVFEVLSRSSGRTDRIVKVREYAAVDSIRRYVIVESTGIGLMVLQHDTAGESWLTSTLTEASDILRLPEIGIEISLGDIYENVEFETASDAG